MSTAIKKKRAPVACDVCARARVRCYGDKPCRRCREYGHDCQFARTLKRRGRKVPRTHPQLDDDDDETPRVPVQSTKAGSVVDHQTSEDGHLPASHDSQHRLFQHHDEIRLSYPLPDAMLENTSPDPWASLEFNARVRSHRAREPRISSETSMRQQFSSPGIDRHERGLFDQQHTSVGGPVITCSDQPHRQPAKEPESLSSALPPPLQVQTGFIASDKLDPKYACLKSILPLIKDILHPETALQLLHAYFARADDSLFNQASPYVLTPILCKEDVLDPNSARSPSAFLLVTMIWVSAHTAHLPALLRPVTRQGICDKLGQLVLAIQCNRDADEHSPMPRSFSWQKTSDAPALSINLPQAGGMSSDDVLSVILITIMVSGGDMKASAVYWWQKAVQWARQLGLHQLDSPHASQAGPTVTSPDANGDTRTAVQSAYQREQQRRTFWLLYCLDRHLALSYNREPLLVDGEHFVFQPLSEDQWQSLATRSTDNMALAERQQGPFLVITGKGFFEYFLPLMALLGDVITTRRLKNHPRMTANNRAEFVVSVAQRLELCDKSIANLGHPIKATVWTPPAMHQPSPSEAGRTVVSATSPSEGSAILRSSRLNPQCHLVIHYARFILCVLRILLYGEWDAITLLGSSSPTATSPLQSSVSDWITSPSFNECAGSAIKAAEVVSQILQDDPELSLMPYLFGIYLFHGSLILLLFADRMSSVHGGPNESVERACEVIIRAHEACIVTLNTEFQRVFRKVMRITLLLVQAQAQNLQSESTHGRAQQDFAGTWVADYQAANAQSPSASQIAEIFTIRRELLGVLRWNCGGEGLAI